MGQAWPRLRKIGALIAALTLVLLVSLQFETATFNTFEHRFDAPHAGVSADITGADHAQAVDSIDRHEGKVGAMHHHHADGPQVAPAPSAEATFATLSVTSLKFDGESTAGPSLPSSRLERPPRRHLEEAA